MKKIILILSVLISFTASAQYDSTKSLQPVNGNGFSWKNGRFAGSIIIPLDTPKLAVKDSGGIAYKGNLAVWDGHKWKAIASGTCDTCISNYSISSDSTEFSFIRVNGDTLPPVNFIGLGGGGGGSYQLPYNGNSTDYLGGDTAYHALPPVVTDPITYGAQLDGGIIRTSGSGTDIDPIRTEMFRGPSVITSSSSGSGSFGTFVQFNPSSTISTYSLTLPSTSGNEVQLFFGGTMTTGDVVTTLTLITSGSDTFMGSNVFSNVKAGTYIEIKSVDTKWFVTNILLTGSGGITQPQLDDSTAALRALVAATKDTTFMAKGIKVDSVIYVGKETLVLDSSYVRDSIILNKNHFISSGTTPGIAVGTTLTGTASVTGTDMAGIATLNISGATSYPTNAHLIDVTFAQAYAVAPVVTFSPASSSGSDFSTGVAARLYVVSSTTGFYIAIATSGTSSVVSGYKWAYTVIQ